MISDVAGDGILALFGAIKNNKNPVRDAINAVRVMNVGLTQFKRYLNQMYDRSFGIRAGINFGNVIVGSFDTGMMSKISAIGDAVNLASRIETANKDCVEILNALQDVYLEKRRFHGYKIVIQDINIMGHPVFFNGMQ